MHLSIPSAQLAATVCRQLENFFPDGEAVPADEIAAASAGALERLEHCFRQIRVGHYCRDGVARFNHLYSDQYLVFLWFLSNELWRRGRSASAMNKVYLLNKALHAFDCAYDTRLPDVFVIIHGVGTVLGKAEYGDGLVVYHGCTVGQTQNRYPRLGRGVGLGAGATVIGSCELGDGASVGANCALIHARVEAGASAYRDDTGALRRVAGRPAAIAAQYFSDDFLARLLAG